MTTDPFPIPRPHTTDVLILLVLLVGLFAAGLVTGVYIGLHLDRPSSATNAERRRAP